MRSPDKSEVLKARKDAGHTQTQAAEVVYGGKRKWQSWELGEYPMPYGLYELYLIKTRLPANLLKQAEIFVRDEV